MKKIIRFSIPFIAACLMLGMLIFLAGASSQALASEDPALKWWVGKELAKRAVELQATLLVTTLEDELNNDGDCSLREAITAANDNSPVDACSAGDAVTTDIITFDVVGMINVTSQLSVTAGGSLEIDGGKVITVSGGGATRLWWVESGSVLTLKHLAVVDGYAIDGAGLFNNGGSVTINDCILSENIVAGGAGGGIYNNAGALVVSNSTLSGNIGSDYGGGGIYNGFATLIVTDSFLFENSAINGGAIRNSGGTITITHSTLSDNIAFMIDNFEGVGGAISNIGSLKVTNSTLSGNHSDGVGAAIYSWISTVIVDNSTLSGNFAGLGGAISNSYNPLTVTNSIVANYPVGSDCMGPIIDGGHNISSDDTCGFNPANDSLPDTDPLLGPLLDNGGLTWTHALLEDSPAIDAGDGAHCPSTDQRGVPRPQDGDGDGEAICDIGSYELESSPRSPNSVTITGEDEGMTDQTYSFKAAIEPISTTLPLEYVWQASGQAMVTHTSGLTDTVNFAWEIPGTVVITVTASNPAGSVIDTSLITITDVSISRLVASNDSPTLLGEPTTLNATIQAGTNVIYTWDFGDRESGSGAVITHTYPVTGTYTATVTANNSANMLTANTKVTIIISLQTTYLPLVIKSIQAPLAPATASSPSGGGVLETLIVFGALSRWKSKG